MTLQQLRFFIFINLRFSRTDVSFNACLNYTRIDFSKTIFLAIFLPYMCSFLINNCNLLDDLEKKRFVVCEMTCLIENIVLRGNRNSL